MLEREVKVNNKYRHFKGHLYVVIAIGKDCEDLSEKVIYKNVDNGEVWVRDKDDFLSIVDKEKYPLVKQKYRFELCEE